MSTFDDKGPQAENTVSIESSQAQQGENYLSALVERCEAGELSKADEEILTNFYRVVSTRDTFRKWRDKALKS